MEPSTTERPPYLWALTAFAVIFCLYLLTLSPTTAMWDASEYIASAAVLGIPHPPGNPLFTLMAHAWGLLPLASEYARRINIFAAFMSAASAGIWFLVAERWLRNILPARLPRLLATFAGIFASATAWTVWNQSTVNEKVYTVSMLSIALVAWFAVRWADEPAGKRRDRWLVAALYILALTSTNHTMGVLGAPVLVIYVALTDWRVILRPAFLLASVIVVVVGVTPNYVYLPLRAAQHPAINEGEAAGFFSPALMATLNRSQYLKPDLFPRQPYVQGDVPDSPGHFVAQFGMYWHYWMWQWGRDLGPIAGFSTALFTMLGLGGLLAMWKRDRRAGLAALALLGTLTVLLIIYLNFKFGWYYHLDDKTITSAMREVRDRDYFFIASFAFSGVLIAAGFAALLRSATEWYGERGSSQMKSLIGAPVLVLALIPLVGNRVSAPRNGETLTRDYAIDVLQSVEPYGILITAGDNDTFPLWYAQEVLGVRRDVTLANLSLMGTDWHVRQLQRRDPDKFDAGAAAPMWRNLMNTDTAKGVASGNGIIWQKPAGSALGETIAQLDSIPDWNQVPAGTTISAPGLTMHFARDLVTRSDIIAALLVHDNLGKRPVYFSSSTGDYPDTQLGLGGHLVTQGMVRKVVSDTVVPGSGIVNSEYMGPVDVARTSALLFNTYHVGTITRFRPGGWYDPPSSDMLGMYLRVYASFAPVLQQEGDTTKANRANEIALKVRTAITGQP